MENYIFSLILIFMGVLLIAWIFAMQKVSNELNEIHNERIKIAKENISNSKETINSLRAQRGEAPIGASELEKIEADYNHKRQLGHRAMGASSSFRFQEYFDSIEKERDEAIEKLKQKENLKVKNGNI